MLADPPIFGETNRVPPSTNGLLMVIGLCMVGSTNDRLIVGLSTDGWTKDWLKDRFTAGLAGTVE